MEIFSLRALLNHSAGTALSISSEMVNCYLWSCFLKKSFEIRHSGLEGSHVIAGPVETCTWVFHKTV